MTSVTLAATQMACSWDTEANLARAEELVREAAGQGAQVILLQELFETPFANGKNTFDLMNAHLTRAVSLPAEHVSTPLGLAICANIIAAHGGHIEAQHSTLGGLMVEFSLPIKGRRA